MDTIKTASALPSIRTLAKDQARSQNGGAVAPTSGVRASESAVPKANIVGGGESRLYQAPTSKAIPAPAQKKGVSNAPAKEAPEPAVPTKDTSLRPLTRPKIAEETAIVVDNEDAASATIIRDTKHNRFRLFPAIGVSLKLWLAELKEKYFTKKAPKYTVPETTRRKGVIQKATSKTGKLATFDNTSLQARIRERENRAVPKLPTTTWTANTEPGYALLEAPEEEVAVKNVRVIPRKSSSIFTGTAKVAAVAKEPVPTPKKPTIIIASETEPIVSTPSPQTEPETKPAPQVTSGSAQVQKVNPEPTPVVVSPQAKQKSIRTYVPPSKPLVTNLKPTSLREWLFTLNTNLIALGIAGLVLAIGITLLTGYAIYQKNVSTITVTALPNHPTLLEAPLQILYTNLSGSDAITKQLLDNLNAPGRPDILQLAFATKANGELVPAHAVMSNLAFHTNVPFARSLNALYFGITNDGTPFILLKTTDDTTALGGMFSWEAYLYDDLSPIFGLSDDLGTTETSTFKDRTLGTVDTRTQINATGDVVLAYNEPVKNIIIITTSVATLEALLPLIK